MTPPQAYVLYVIALLLVYVVSYYAGTLNPKRLRRRRPWRCRNT